MPKRISMLAYPGAQILDITGPLEVFARTTRWLRENRARADDAYVVEIIGLESGPIRTSSGLQLVAERGFRDVRRGVDTLLVAGGSTSSEHASNPAILRWLRRQASHVRRLAAVCTGAFFLAEAGLLSGHRATTHWAHCADFARRYPDVCLDVDRIFLKEGNVYTTAGVTAGLDLALALVEEDLGREVSLAVARALVMFLKRPGGQAQFSAQLSEQLAEREPLRELQAYIVENPRADLSVDALAKRAKMSPRSFARHFTRQLAVSPARFVLRARVETARRLLEESSKALDAIGEASGLGSPELLRRAFLRVVGVGPSAYRARFNPPLATTSLRSRA